MWKTLRCEVRGSRSDETIKQDKIVVSNDLNVNILCMSDGSSYSKISHFGSNIVTQRAAEFVTINFDELYSNDDLEIKESLIYYLLISLKKQASLMSVTIDELGANLLLVAVKNNKFIALSLGDGIIGCYHENKMETLFSGGYSTHITSQESLLHLEIKRGLIRGIKGFTLVSSGAANTLYSAVQSDFLDAVGGVIITTDSSTEEELNTKLSEVFNEYVISKTDNDCSVAVLTDYRSASRYYNFSIEEKVLYFKFSLFDENSFDRVRDLDNILQLITTEKSIDDLAKTLNVKAIYLKPKMDLLVDCNLLTFGNGNIYKKIS